MNNEKLIIENEKEQNNKIILFQSRQIRRIWVDNEWWFSVIDIVGALTDSVNPRDYWYRMKVRVKSESGFELSTNCRQFKLEASDGKKRKTDCANTEGILRIIQSIPSPKAEPFKRWLAKVGYERVQEIENPELAQERMKALYEQKGYALRPELSWTHYSFLVRIKNTNAFLLYMKEAIAQNWSVRALERERNLLSECE